MLLELSSCSALPKAGVWELRAELSCQNDGLTSAFEQFSFQRFLNRKNQKKPEKTKKNPETWQPGNLCPFSRKPACRVMPS